MNLRARRWAIIGWGLALAVFAGYIIILFEEFAEQLAGFNIDDIAIYQVMGDFGDFTSFAGFVSAEVFVFLPVLLAVYAIVNGSGTLGGEEDSGRLEPIIGIAAGTLEVSCHEIPGAGYYDPCHPHHCCPSHGSGL